MSSRRKFNLTRDGTLFAAGLAGIVYETLVEHGDRPTLLVLFGAMVGLPAFLKVDESKSKGTPPAPTPEPPAPQTEVKQ